MALPASFLDELRARTPLAALIGRRVKLARSGRNWKGNCPFHNEKSPSFYVYENGYHCFGCGAHGDAIGFVMQAQGLGFMEAVEALAGEAGMEVPRPTQAAAEAERRRAGLGDVLEAAAEAFRRRLFLPEGARALAYLRGRGLTDETIARFGLGWSGDGRGGLVADLARRDMPAALLHEAGLLRSTEEGGPGGELFYNRVMFPIRDRQGRVVSFGGRILGDGQPKYVNGPETAVFSKRRTLYGLDLARAGVRTGQDLIVVEGYMDVIGLHQAGFTGAVAPLGTALTEEQLGELWRLSPNPTLCFDGDAAGARAALRALTVALPLTTAERTLSCIYMGGGRDPADVAGGADGAAEFGRLLAGREPVERAVFMLLSAQHDLKSTAGRARLKQALEEMADGIADRTYGWEVRRAFREAFGRLTRPAAPGRASRGERPAPPPMVPRTPPSAAAAGGERARALVAILLRHPVILPDVEEAFGSLALPTGLARVRDAILRWREAAESLDSTGLIAHLTRSGLESEVVQVLAAVPVPLPSCAAPDAMPADAEAGWWHFFGLMDPSRLDAEVATARSDFQRQGDEAAQRRLVALSAAREALRRGEQGDQDA